MENLSNKFTEVNEGDPIKALSIAFPENLFSENLDKTSIRFHKNEISHEQFANLHTIVELYSMTISIKKSAINMEITLTKKEAKDENGI